MASSTREHSVPQSRHETEVPTGQALTVSPRQLPMVCIGALPPGGLAHTRYLCKKLRARFLKVKIVVGRWGLSGDIEANREQLQDAGADLVAATILETRRQLSSLLPILMQQQAKPVTSGKDGVAQENSAARRSGVRIAQGDTDLEKEGSP